MANNKNPNQKQPGEKEPGTFHFNPGNMSGKTVGTSRKDESEKSDPVRRRGRDDQQDKNKKSVDGDR